MTDMINTIKLLLVDDHAIFRDGLRALLEMEEDMQVVGETASGHEALRLIGEAQPDIVLLDIAMPDIDGVEVCRQIRHSFPGSAVLVLSAYDSAELVTAALTAGASGYVLKTIDHRRMVESIRAVARGEMLLSPSVAAKVVQQLSHTQQEKTGEFDALTGREKEVFILAAQNLTNSEIADRLVISETTVKTHLRNISNKLNLSSKGEMRSLALRLGLLPPESG